MWLASALHPHRGRPLTAPPALMQVLIKSSKMIPVMLMGAFLFGRLYSATDYTCAALIAGGISIFALQEPAGCEH